MLLFVRACTERSEVLSVRTSVEPVLNAVEVLGVRLMIFIKQGGMVRNCEIDKKSEEVSIITILLLVLTFVNLLRN